MKKHIIVCGLPGTGKTTLCKALAQELNMTYINDYVIYQELDIKVPLHDRKQVSEQCASHILNYLQSRDNVVLDLDYSVLPRQAKQLGFEGKIVYLGFDNIDAKSLSKAFRAKDGQIADDELNQKINYFLEISSFCKRECQKHNFDFVAIDQGRDKTINALKNALIEDIKPRQTIKAIMFDFDGTLTIKEKNLWDKVWESAGYDIGKDSYYHSLTKRFLAHEYDYQKWCDLTCEALRKNRFSKKQLNDIVSSINLIKGLQETCEDLTSRGIVLCIVSGGEKTVICDALKGCKNYFSKISANVFEFDVDGIIEYIKSTKYDFEGKAQFIQDFVLATGIKPSEILFVGNSDNDEWAYMSGCKTLCVNAYETDTQDKAKWHNAIIINDLREILKYIGE